MDRMRCGWWIAVVLILNGTVPRVVDAGCNVIPVMQRSFPSTRGRITSPVAPLGATVELTLGTCETTAGHPLFEPVPGANAVHVIFEPPGGTPTDLTRAVTSVGGCGTAGCERLTFTLPSQTQVSGFGNGFGLAGPARIRVTRASDATLLAEIGQLRQPTDSCTSPPDHVFGHFTVLPAPNSLATLTKKTGSLRMTIDGQGNLLVPLDHSSALPSAGEIVGVLEDGNVTIPAFNGSNESILDTIAASVGFDPEQRGLVRSFSLDGRPLPPIVGADQRGWVFGTADVPTSLIRIAREDENGEGLFDVTDRLEAGVGPIVVKTTKFSARSDTLVPLHGLRSSGRAAAFARSEAVENKDLNGDGDKNQGDRVVHLVDLVAGKSKLVERAASNVERIENGMPVSEGPAIELRDRRAVFLESERAHGNKDQNGINGANDHIIRVYSSRGEALTPKPKSNPDPNTQIDASNRPAVDGWFAAIGGRAVFFRRPAGTLQVFDTSARKFRSSTPLVLADFARVSGERAAVVGRLSTTPTAPPRAFVYDVDPALANDRVTALNVDAKGIAIAGDLVAFSDASDRVSWMRVPTTGPVPAPTSSGRTAKDTHLEAVDAVTGDVIVFIERGTQKDPIRVLAADGSTTGCSLPPIAAMDFVVGDGLVAYRAREDQEGRSLNADGDRDDLVMHVIDLEGDRCPISTFRSARPCTIPGCPPRAPYVIRDRTVFFLMSECDEGGQQGTAGCQGGTDLNGDGDDEDVVLNAFEVSGRAMQVIAATSPGTGTGPLLPHPALEGSFVFVDSSVNLDTGIRNTSAEDDDGTLVTDTLVDAAHVGEESDVCAAKRARPDDRDDTAPVVYAVGDADRDGTLDPFDTCVETRNGAQDDADLDRLGDRCDPTPFCGEFTPPAPRPVPDADADCRRAAARAALRHLESRLETVNDCLARVADGTLVGDPATLCRGATFGSRTALPMLEKVATSLARASAALTKTIDGACRGAGPGAPTSAGVRGVNAAMADAAARVTFGEVAPDCASHGGQCGSCRPDPRGCQAGVARASTRYLVSIVEAVQACLDRVQRTHARADAQQLCLGRITAADGDGAGRLELPRDEKTASVVARAERRLRAELDDACPAESLVDLDVCGGAAHSADEAARCLACTHWRYGIEAARAVYDPPRPTKDEDWPPVDGKPPRDGYPARDGKAERVSSAAAVSRGPTP